MFQLSLFLILTFAFIFNLCQTQQFQEPSSKTKAAALNFLFFGDWGYSGHNQTLVAQEMGYWSGNHSAKFLIALGDNFYIDGVRSDTDIQWEATYRRVYTSPYLTNIPWYAILGNHDYHRNYQAQIDYYLNHRDDRWTMPSQLYNVIYDIPDSNGFTMEIIFIDSCIISPSETEQTMPNGIHAVSSGRIKDYLKQLEDLLKKSQATWLFVAGHYTIYSMAEHGDNKEMIMRLVPLLKKYGVQAYFHGHDHVLEHISWEGIEYICSGHGTLTNGYPLGNMNFTRGSIASEGFHFGTIGPGFSGATVTTQTFHFEFFNQYGEQTYSFLLANPRTHQIDSQTSSLPTPFIAICALISGFLFGALLISWWFEFKFCLKNTSNILTNNDSDVTTNTNVLHQRKQKNAGNVYTIMSHEDDDIKNYDIELSLESSNNSNSFISN